MDMFMVPSTYQTPETDLVTLVNNGVVPTSRVNDAVRRILTQKFELGLFEHPFTNRANIGQIGDAAHPCTEPRRTAARPRPGHSYGAAARMNALLRHRGYWESNGPARRPAKGPGRGAQGCGRAGRQFVERVRRAGGRGVGGP